MATPARSPVLGYNHNLKYRGRVFHVQTEDSGPGHARIFTHLYFGGSIVASKRHEYDAAAPSDIVRGLMQSQHKSILRDLKGGRHDAQLLQFFAKRGESLDAQGNADADADEALPDGAGAGTGARIVAAAPIAQDATRVPSALAGAQLVSDSVSPEVLAQFAHAFDDDPAEAGAAAGGGGKRTGSAPAPKDAGSASPLAAAEPAPTAHPTIAVRPNPPVPGSVRVERTVSVGQAPTVPPTVPTPQPRARRPGHSIPYIVQQGSHPVAGENAQPEIHVPTLTMPAAPIVPRAKRTDPMAAAAAPASLPGTTKTESAATLCPPAPLDPAAAAGQSAPITAAAVGAMPTEMVSREDNKSLDEVIMAYLARSVEDEDEQKNVG